MTLAMPVAAETAGPAVMPGRAALACLVIAARQRGVHLTVDQLTRDNVLTGEALDTADLIRCARRAGLEAASLRIGWSHLIRLGKALPAIARLNNGAHVVVRRVEGQGEDARLVLQDSGAEDHELITVDRMRFEAAWSGALILVKRNYAVADEGQPFSIRLVAAMMVRERWVVRDIVICAVVLSVLALAPIVFWRLLSDRVIYFKAYNTLYVLCIAMAVVVLFEAILSYVRQHLVVHLTTRVDIGLSTYLFDKLLNLPIDFFERTQVGRVTHDAQQLWKIRSFLTGQLFGTVLDAGTMMIFLPVMFVFSPIMTAIVLASCAVIAAWIVLMLPYCRRKASAVETAEAARGAFLVQTIHGIRTVKSLALDARQRHIWDIHTARVAKLRMAEGQAGNILFAVVKPLERFAISGSFGIGVYLALSSNDPVYIGALFAFLLLSQRVTGPLLQMARLISQYDEARIAVSVVSNLVNQPAEEGRGTQGIRTPVQGHVQFSGVTFKYQGASSPALREVTFEVPMGTTIGVMGRSGSGKTTVARLLQRLHSNYEGLIKIDGIDVREYDVDHLRRSLGVVLQDNYLFSGSIRENIQAAKPEATFEEVVRAARLAGAEEFIDKLPRGYDTHIFEGSSNLSGGQRQRLAIARALIIDPRVLILDEATSALDADSEAIVNANIARIARGRTLIIISHRLSSLVSADAILVLERGQIEDIGRHEELVERCSIYRSLWDQQTQHVHRASPPPESPQRGLVRVA